MTGRETAALLAALVPLGVAVVQTANVSRTELEAKEVMETMIRVVEATARPCP